MVMLVGAPQDAREAARGVDLSSPYAPAHPYALRGPHLFFFFFSERFAQGLLFPWWGGQERCLL